MMHAAKVMHLFQLSLNPLRPICQHVTRCWQIFFGTIFAVKENMNIHFIIIAA